MWLFVARWLVGASVAGRLELDANRLVFLGQVAVGTRISIVATTSRMKPLVCFYVDDEGGVC